MQPPSALPQLLDELGRTPGRTRRPSRSTHVSLFPTLRQATVEFLDQSMLVSVFLGIRWQRPRGGDTPEIREIASVAALCHQFQRLGEAPMGDGSKGDGVAKRVNAIHVRSGVENNVIVGPITGIYSPSHGHMKGT